jgi:uncharacterized protein YhbP (UPF0306 family)
MEIKMNSLGIDMRIVAFIEEHHIFTLATCANNKPYTSTCFYVYLEEHNMFVFTSDHHTRHIKDAVAQNHVAGAVALETSMVGLIQGLQFTGIISELAGESLKIAQKAYLKKFPVARLMETHLWGIVPDYLKMTHNRLGFGKKLIWPAKPDE